MARADVTVTDRVLTHVERYGRNSGDGNPRYRVGFADGYWAVTAKNAAVNYTITNSEYRDAAVRVITDKHGDIIHVLLPGEQIPD